MTIYRVKYGKKCGAASWGDWKYYEDDNIESMKSDLLNAYLDINSKGNSKPSRLSFMWACNLRGKRDFDYTNVFAVEKMTNDEWTPVEVEFIKPDVIVS